MTHHTCALATAVCVSEGGGGFGGFAQQPSPFGGATSNAFGAAAQQSGNAFGAAAQQAGGFGAQQQSAGFGGGFGGFGAAAGSSAPASSSAQSNSGMWSMRR